MLKYIKPTTPSQRRLIKLSSRTLRKKSFLKKEIKSLKKNSTGRNNSGKITIKSRRGRHKKKYRKIRFFRANSAIGCTCEYSYTYTYVNDDPTFCNIYEESPAYCELGHEIDKCPLKKKKKLKKKYH